MSPPTLCPPGSWCHGTGRRRSRVQLIAVHAALGALILMLVVLVISTGEGHQESQQ